MNFYRCVRPWKRHSVGQVITESEYNKCPQEIKNHGNFELIIPTAAVAVVVVDPLVNAETETDTTKFHEPVDEVKFEITGDALKAIDRPKHSKLK